MIVVLGDLILDFSLHIPRFPVKSGDIQRATYLEIGPGGATNIAIAASRLGLQVACLGEVGDDRFGRIVLEGLERERVDVSGVIVTPGAETPVAGVVVDSDGEPAYLGYAGSLKLRRFHDGWRAMIMSAEALFTNGWAEHEAVPKIVLEGMRLARSARVPVFFDPGPGNPEIDPTWLREAVERTDILLINEAEIKDITGLEDPHSSANQLISRGVELVVIKRGAAGCWLLTEGEHRVSPGFPVQVTDATGAGDSLDAAVIYGYLKKLPLESLGILANAAGAAKVQKRGTGHNVPTMAEIKAILEHFDHDAGLFFPVEAP